MNTLKKSFVILSAFASTVLSAANPDETKDTKSDMNETKEQPKSVRGEGGKCYDESTHLLNLGVGFGGSAYYDFRTGTGYSKGRTPVFVLSYEQPLRNKVGPGYIGLGPYFSFQNAHERYDYYYKYNGVNDKYYHERNWNYFVIALKGAYHWDVLNSEKAELYAGTIIGVRFNTITYTDNNPDPGYSYKETSSGNVYPAIGVYAGARWYFVPNVALFGEAGVGVSWLTGGLTFKF